MESPIMDPDPNNLPSFPVWALLPKRETGAEQFVAKNPHFDGRGTIIAILDSGVDPGAAGLQVTTDGKRKVLDRIDASGAGDVDMRRQADPKDGVLKGLTGRDLRLPLDCLGFKDYRVGVKRAFSLYPNTLKERMIKERQRKHWDPYVQPILTKCWKKTKELPEVTPNEDPNAKFGRDNVQAELEVITTIDKKFKDRNGDLGPMYDVVLFHDGDLWNVLIDTSETGELSEGIRLRPFRETGEFAPLTNDDRLNISVNVYEKGDIVEIVSMCSSHGTHVSAIAAANFPDDPPKNGVAPGAQIVSITIGDARLGSMETGTALARAMYHIMRAEHYKVDVMNMSYGEHSHWSNTGRLGELMGEVVNKHGAIFVVSAGNAGPALFTIGTPPDISTNSLIGVGAYVSPEMMTSIYASREKVRGTPYTWSSRGPTMDGDRGVTVCAPGGAITSVPHFSLKGSELMSGTSMAAPHCSGSLALLVSGLKQESIGFSPFSVKRAIENTALVLKDRCPYAQGHGLLQVNEAYEVLKKYGEAKDRDVRFSVKCNNSKGVHIRGKAAFKEQQVLVKVQPILLNHEEQENEDKIAIQFTCTLASPDTWVSYPKFLELPNRSRDFWITVDPMGLPYGANSTFIKGYDSKNPNKGHLFEIPVTVIKSEPLEEGTRPRLVKTDLRYSPGTLKRFFVLVPDQSTWATVQIRSKSDNSSRFVLHTVVLLPKMEVRTLEEKKYFELSDCTEVTQSFAVRGGHTLEVCLAKQSFNLGDALVDLSLQFHGIPLIGGDTKVWIHGAQGITRFDISSPIQREDVQPEIKLKSLVNNYRPIESSVYPLDSRDVVPPHRQVYELALTYQFGVQKATEIMPDFPWLSGVLYESEFESQLWLLYNSHKQLIASGDAKPNDWCVKVEKEDYTLKAHVRHEDSQLLEKLSDLVLQVSFKLPSVVSLDVYTSHAQASTLGKASNSFVLAKGSTATLYTVLTNSIDKYLKNATIGSYFKGTLALAKDPLGRNASALSVFYSPSESAKRDKHGAAAIAAKKSGSKSVPVTSAETMEEAKRDFQLGWVAKLDPMSTEGQALFKELNGNPDVDQVQLHLHRLNALDVFKLAQEEEPNGERVEAAFQCCAWIQANIDLNQALAHGSVKYDGSSNATEVKKDMDKARDHYFEALNKAGYLQVALGRSEDAQQTHLLAVKYLDVTDSRIILFTTAYAEMVQHWGRAMKLVMHQLDGKPGSFELESRLLKLLGKLGWKTVYEFHRRSITLRYPQGYELI
ncbi:hypothetical protein TCAL_12592 [Tigriopus californicus]|uniref:Tripeptidyl-peptidase 2 n=1 Tax=Tigriopus californicus TaxID=6832 RepID=A0A553PDM2_TIGCA|nr:tripeptidyl-peptidase 2-like [Tigriopus californicus]TRY75766.1 hypothetical protein TCAL_12592 [Tigriopus californicus]